jgi:large subunit ribosomal protein L17e
MGRTVYSRQPPHSGTAVKTSGKDLRTSFKNTFATANAIKGMALLRAMDYMQAVISHQRCVPFRRFNHSMGRCSQATEFGTDKGRWPEKSCKVILGLLQNLEANA